jgi:hypothetical protein
MVSCSPCLQIFTCRITLADGNTLTMVSISPLRRERTSPHNSSSSYKQVAISFAVSEITVKRHCAGLGRGKDWRRGRRQSFPDAQKFWRAVDRTGDGCWEWKGCRNNSGYGFVHFDGKSQAAHRVAYALTYCAIPEGIKAGMENENE